MSDTSTRVQELLRLKEKGVINAAQFLSMSAELRDLEEQPDNPSDESNSDVSQQTADSLPPSASQASVGPGGAGGGVSIELLLAKLCNYWNNIGQWKGASGPCNC